METKLHEQAHERKSHFQIEAGPEKLEDEVDPFGELTPEEREELNQLQAPFDSVPTTMRWDEELMRELLSIVLNDTERLRHVVQPDSFTNDIHKKSCTIAYSFFDEHNSSPSRTWVRNELLEAIADRSQKVRFHYLSELAVVYEYYNPGIESAEAIINKARRWSELVQAKQAINSFLESQRTGSPMAIHEFAAKCESIGTTASGQEEALEAMDFFAYAERHEPEYLVNPYLESGNLYLFSGESKAGKSTLTTSLSKSLVTGEPWFGFPCQQTPVVIVDLENPAYYLAANLKRGFPIEKWQQYTDKLHVVTTKPTVTVPWLKRLLKQRSLEKAVIIIDSARAAFEKQFAGVAGWENSASEVRKALQPISEFCHETGNTVILIHHHNKSGQTSGSTDWHAGVDFIWSYYKNGTQRTLAVEGRLVQEVPPLVFGFDTRKHELYLEGTKSEVKQAAEEEKVAGDLEQVLDAIPFGKENALLGKEITEKLTFSVGKTNKLLGELKEDCRVATELFRDGRSHGILYWREKILG